MLLLATFRSGQSEPCLGASFLPPESPKRPHECILFCKFSLSYSKSVRQHMAKTGRTMEAETPLQAPALSLPAQPHPLPALQQPARRASRSICSPPEGPFSYDSPELVWEEGTYASTRFHSVNISAERIQNFVLGENARGQTSFCVFKSERPWKAEQASHWLHRCPYLPSWWYLGLNRHTLGLPSRNSDSLFPVQGLPSRTSVLSKVTYWCRVREMPEPGPASEQPMHATPDTLS